MPCTMPPVLASKHRVRYSHNHILFASAASVADMNDLCLIQSGCVVAVHGGKHLAVSVLYLLRSRYRIGSHAFQRATVATKHTGVVIFCQRAQWSAAKNHSKWNRCCPPCFYKSW